MSRTVFALLVLLTTTLMGSSFSIGKLGLSYFSPLLLVGLRFTLAGVLLALWIGRRHLPTTWQGWRRILLIGTFQTAGVMGCSFLSLQTIPAGQTSILTFTSPLLVVVFGSWVLGSKYRWSQWGGVLVGCIGMIVTIGFQLELEVGTAWGLGSALFWAIATIAVKKWGDGLNIWVLSAYQMLCGGILVLGAALLFESPVVSLTVPAIGLLVYLAVIGSIVQFATWYYLLDQGDPGQTSAFLFLVPIFGLLSGWLILGELVQWHVYAGGALVLLGIFLVNWAPAGKHKQLSASTLP